jgi:hypothetical protein
MGRCGRTIQRVKPQVTDYIRAVTPTCRSCRLVNNWNGHEWEGAKLGRMLANPAARARVVEQLVAYVERHRFAGDQHRLRGYRGQGATRFSALHGRAVRRAASKESVGLGECAGQRPRFRLPQSGRNADYSDSDGLRRALVHRRAGPDRQPALVRQGVAPTPARHAGSTR